MAGRSDFWIVMRSEFCHDRPWAVPGVPSDVLSQMPESEADGLMRGRPFNYPVAKLWLERRSGGRLGDMPVCDGAFFVISNRMHDILSPFYCNSVVADDIEIRHGSKGSEVYKLVQIKQGSAGADVARGWLSAVSEMPSGGGSDYGYYFDTDTWDGSLIFRMGKNGNRMVVFQSVADAIRGAGLVGVELVRLDLFGLVE